MQGVPIGEGVTLLLAAATAAYPDDIEAIRTVAAPLLKLLERRRLTGPPGKEEAMTTALDPDR